MIINAKITGISYKPLLCKDLTIYKDNQLEQALNSETAFLLNNNGNVIALSSWVSPKRTRSYPYSRVYNTLNKQYKITTTHWEENMNKHIASPLRYPGGKSRAIKAILQIIPKKFSEFREPFVGGGSVFISAKQNINHNSQFIINDLNFDLFCFWKFAKEENLKLYGAVKEIKDQENDGRKLFKYYTENNVYSDFAYVYEWELQYGMNNYKQGKADKGKELFISNYKIDSLLCDKKQNDLFDELITAK
jgi:hypothetical protein